MQEPDASNMNCADNGKSDSSLRVFISYSRRDYHFAEILSTRLAASNEIYSWMDTAQLGPGVDWANAIDDAIDSASALVLIASTAAMESGQVADEWTRAIRNGIPVFVVFASRCHVAPLLRSYPTYDLRSRFASGLDRLHADIVSSQPTQETKACRAIYCPPVEVCIVVLAVICQMLMLALACGCCLLSIPAVAESEFELQQRHVTLIFTEGPTYLLLLIGCAAIGMQCANIYSLAVHRLRPLWFLSQQLVTLGVFGVFLPFLVAANANRYKLPGAVSQVVAEVASVWPSALIAFGVAALVAAGVVYSSSLLLRYSEAGDEAPYLRRRITGRPLARFDDIGAPLTDWRDSKDVFIETLRGRHELADPQTWTYELLSDRNDRAIPELIRLAFADVGFKERSGADWRIVLVGNTSDISRLAELIDTPAARTIYLLITNIEIPSDAYMLRRYQWLDFRTLDVEVLRVLLRVLASKSGTVGVLPVPISPTRYRLPRAVAAQTVDLRVGIAIGLTFSIGLILTRTAAWGSLWGNLAAAILAASWAFCCIRILVRITNRSYTASRYLQDAVASGAHLAVGMILLFVYVNPNLSFTIIYLVVSTFLIARPLVQYWSFRQGWFLSATPAKRVRSTLAVFEGLPTCLLMALSALTLLLAFRAHHS